MVLADAPAARRATETAPGAPGPRSLRSSGAPPDVARTWLRLALFCAAMLFALAGLSTLLGGILWWFATALLVVLPALAVGIAARLGRRPWQPFAAGAVVALVSLTFGYARDASWFGVIPNADTFGRWNELIGEGISSITVQRVPAEATPGILFLLALLCLASVVLIAPALDRAPAVAALPLLVVLDIPVVVRSGLASPLWFVLTVVAFLALLRVGRRRMPLPGVLVTAVAVVIGALVLPVAFPPAQEPARGAAAGVGTGFNPLIALGDDLRRDDVVMALSYVTDAPGGLYLRLASLDRFTGINWEPDAVTDPENDVAAFPSPQGLDDAVPRAEYSATIGIGDVNGRWLPVPYPATSITGLSGDWRWEADGLAVRSDGGQVRGQEYDVSFLDIQPDLAQLTTVTEPDVPARFLELPGELPELVQQTADEVAGEGSTYEKAIALQRFFADGDFEYSVEAPVEAGYDGTGIGVIERFLVEKSGYCVHFASSMAVMARAVGIPSRIVVGFQPGEAASIGGASGFEVSSADMHAWPELYFEGIGWLRFEPTPGRGALPDYSSLEAIDDPETPEFEGANPAATPAVPAPSAPELADVEPVDSSPVATEVQNPLPVILAVALAVLAVMLIPAGLRVLVRLRRMRLVRSGRDAGAAWAEIRDTAHDHEWSAPDSETPRQLSTRLAVVVGSDAVARLRAGVESVAYGRPGSSPMTVEDVGEVRRAIASAASLRVRLRAIFLPPSLTARAGFTTGARHDAP